VSTGGKKYYAAAFGAEDKTSIDSGPTFEIVLAQTANAETGMKVRSAKFIAHGIDGSCDIAAAGFRKFANNPPKGF
jgi:hypothetical protein